MARIVETQAGPAHLGRPGVERLRLAALHVGLEAAEPEQAGLKALPDPHRNRALVGSYRERFQARITHIRARPPPPGFLDTAVFRNPPLNARGLWHGPRVRPA